MSKTPSRDTNTTNYFTPKELFTPTKDNSGISKTIFTHISMLQSLLHDWIKFQNNGNKICRSIVSLKLHEYQDDDFPREVKVLMESLLQMVDGLKNVLEGVATINKQLQALAQLNSTNTPVICTWTANQIAVDVYRIYESLERELSLKKTVLENIAHCRQEHLIEVYASSWEFNVFFDINEASYLFMEIGLAGIM